eukprot:GFUD01132585.1.p1 GENE.GFUD01132585.1~~GFUD01132585.1.p1  ORF type:complete len:403 (+),score=92.16 GFUD01132585.1:187-1395(+)
MTNPLLLLLLNCLIPYLYLTESKTYTKSSSPPRRYYYRKITPSPTPPATSSPTSFLQKLLHKKVSTLAAGWLDGLSNNYYSGKYPGEENPLAGDPYPWSKKTGKYRTSIKMSKTSPRKSTPAKSLPSVDDTMDGILPVPLPQKMSGVESEAVLEPLERIQEKMEDLKTKFGFSETDRGDLDNPEIVWRTGKPDYTRANYQYFKGKTQNHAAGSLEELVENLVKTWETQASHFKEFSQWTTIDHSNYKIKVNDEEETDGTVAYKIGNFNALMQNCSAYKKYGDLSFEESHDLFRGAFTSGFPWEVLRVLSEPPYVMFTWRHWGILDGKFQDNVGHGEQLEMYGVCRVTVNQELKIQKIEVYYDPETFIKALEGKVKPSELKAGNALLGDVACPHVGKDVKLRV